MKKRVSPGGGRLHARRRLTWSFLAQAKAVLPSCHTHERERQRERKGEAHLTCSKSQSRRGAKVSTQAKREIRKRWLNVGHDVQFK